MNDILERTIHGIAEGVEQWKIDHDEAQVCFQLQEAIKLTVFCCERILDVADKTRLAAFQGKINDETFEKRQAHFDLMFNALRFVVSKLASEAKKCENHGYEIEGIEALREWKRNLEAFATPDDQFFTGLVAARDAAINQHREGLTEPMECLDD